MNTAQERTESTDILMNQFVTCFTLALMENILKRSVRVDCTLRKTLEPAFGPKSLVAKIAKSKIRN